MCLFIWTCTTDMAGKTNGMFFFSLHVLQQFPLR